jgi:YD repeat-containing protein
MSMGRVERDGTEGAAPVVALVLAALSGALLSAPAAPVAAGPESPGAGRVDPPYQASAGDPVNTLLGNFWYDRTDLRIPAEGPALRFTRSYSSLMRPVEPRAGDRDISWPLGPGWTHSYHMRLTRDPTQSPDDLVLWLPVAATRQYRPNGDGTYATPQGETASLVKHPNATFTVSHPDGLRWDFGTDGRLSGIVDAAGRRNVLHYNAQGRLETVSDPARRGVLRFAYDGPTGLLQSVTDWDDPPRVVRFGYDAAGRLVRVIDREGGYTQYAYDDSAADRTHLLTTLTDALNHVALTVAYDAQGRVVRQQDARGRQVGTETAFVYAQGADGARVTTMTYPPSGLAPEWKSVIEDTYDPQGRIVRRVYRPAPDEVVDERYAYDETWSSRTATDPQGRPLTPAAEQPDGGAPRRDCAAYGEGLDALGPAPFLFQPGPLPAPPADGAPRAYYEGAGEVSPPRETVDGGGTRVTYEFDRVGRPVTVHLRPPEGGAAAQWRLTYDREDRLRVLEGPPGADGAPLRLEYRYDAVGNRTVALGPSGQVIRCHYDERDGLREVQRSPDPWTDPEQEPARAEVIRFDYDDRGNLLRETAGGESTGGTVATTDYWHDGLNRLRRIRHAPAGPDAPPPSVTEFAYDEHGRRVVPRR